ncbi:CU044_2847 family protein [Streptomyces flavofungini]|uniref:CU044_2847 family protein n=1 Tax=Streptomyces flavofungini TaxID=68200 RepID=UPI001E28A685|nr:CU044_2847 family protein [Streptomyces flavofungini]
MDGLVQFTTEGGAHVVLADVDDDGSGARLVSRGEGPALAARTFEASLGPVRTAAESALRVFRDGDLAPDSVEIEFGVRMTAEAGAVIVKGSGEGHLLVRLSWSPEGRSDGSGNSGNSGNAAPEARGNSGNAAPEARGNSGPTAPEARGNSGPTAPEARGNSGNAASNGEPTPAS